MALLMKVLRKPGRNGQCIHPIEMDLDILPGQAIEVDNMSGQVTDLDNLSGQIIEVYSLSVVLLRWQEFATRSTRWQCFLTCHCGGGAGGEYRSMPRLGFLIGNRWMSRLQDCSGCPRMC